MCNYQMSINSSNEPIRNLNNSSIQPHLTNCNCNFPINLYAEKYHNIQLRPIISMQIERYQDEHEDLLSKCIIRRR